MIGTMLGIGREGCIVGGGAALTGTTLGSGAVPVGTLCSGDPVVSAFGSLGGNGGGLAVARRRIWAIWM